MKYEILLLGKTKDSFLAAGIREYLTRLKHYTDINVKILKTKKNQGNDELVKDIEAEILISNIKPSSVLVALDSRGNEYSSREFSNLISKWENSGVKHISFVIGGPLGLAPRVLKKARSRISLSKMTFTHDMVRLFLLEQLYRAYTIKAGEKYHK